MNSKVHRSDLWFPSYVELKVTWKCHSGILGDSRSESEKKNGLERVHVVGSHKCVWEMLIWEHYQDSYGGGFCRVDPPMWELHWRKLRKTLVYETNAQWSHWSQTWWRGPNRGNGMLQYQCIWGLVDLTSSCRVMSSWKSYANVVQGHLVILCLGAKKNGAARFHVIGSNKCVW